MTWPFLTSMLVAAAAGDPLLSVDDMRFLEDITAAVVDASRVPPDARVAGREPNMTGGTLIRPGGRECYPAFWIRDYAMSLDAGFITPEEQRHALVLTAAAQQEQDWDLPSGSFVPAGAVPDHITFGNKPIFYPGTLDDFEGQGGPQWGYLPSLDDHFFFVHMAAAYVRQTGDIGILKRTIKGRTLMDRLHQAFHVPPFRPDTGLVYANEGTRGVNFGFVDTVSHSGDLLFCSLLRYQAAREMALLYNRIDQPTSARDYEIVAATIRRAIPGLAIKDGWLKASTGRSAQPDVWGTAFAVYLDALDEPLKTAACNALAKAYKDGTIAWRGNIRHVPTSADFSPDTAWEKALTPKNTYQNGAYWGTATGWVCCAIAQVDPPAARKLATEYVQELRDGDFRKGPDFGSPWECFHPDNDHRQNPVYMTSVTCPLAAFFRRIP